MDFDINNLKLDRIRRNVLVITADFCDDDVGTLIVTRSIDDLSFEIVNEFHDEEALELYNKIIGEQTWKK